jgi:bifunctional UDP-N-acetylglucosamine pyrophosphorylase/glucosamine-1-phosphate N-acetyltransferase
MALAPSRALPPVAIILAGGVNSRFWPLREKSLLWFNGASLLARQIGHFAEAGIRDLVIVGNATNADRLTAELIAQDRADATVVVQQDARGMGDALLHAQPLVDERYPNRRLLVCQVHDVASPELVRAMLDAGTRGADAWIAGLEVSTYFPGGYLTLEGDRVTGIVEKPTPGTEPSNVVNIVLHLYNDPAPLWAALRHAYASDATSDDHYERALGELLANWRVDLVRYGGPFQPIKYPWHALDVTSMLLDEIVGQHIAPDVRFADGAGVDGPVVIEPGVRFLPGARVVGPAYVGAQTVLGNFTLVRQSVVGPGCVVGIHTEIARSYVAEGCWFHNNYVGDSVIGPGVSFGAGATTANLRLDERSVPSMVKGKRIDTGRLKLGAICGAHARLGIHARLMPGVKVGEGGVVGPGVNLSNDLPDETMVMVKQEQALQSWKKVTRDRDDLRNTLDRFA